MGSILCNKSYANSAIEGGLEKEEMISYEILRGTCTESALSVAIRSYLILLSPLKPRLRDEHASI